MSFPIPHYQPIPFPVPLWLLETLLVVGFFIHVVFMNVALSGGFVATVALLLGKGKPDSYPARLGHSLAAILPVTTSFAITQGIVPLLFLQLLYGPLYYTSSILMAVPWLSVVLILLVGYYAIYAFVYSKKEKAQKSPLPLLVSGLLFVVIGFLFTNNMSLMLSPDKWAGMYQNNPYGMNLNLGSPILAPRFLHFLISAFAVCGLVIACKGTYWVKRDEGFGQWLMKTGSMLFLVPTMLNVGVGMWYMLSLKQGAMMLFMGQNMLATASFGLSLVLVVVAVLLSLMNVVNPKPLMVKAATALSLVAILGMIVMRHVLRGYMVQGFFSPSVLEVQIQWDLLIAFLILAVGLIIYLVWLLSVLWKAFHPAQSSAEQLS